MKDKKIQELEASFASLLNNLKKIKADDMMEEEDDKLEELYNTISYLFENLASRIAYSEEAFYQYKYDHSKGHLPSCKTASSMEKALKALGMSDDYEVYKPSISVANSKNGVVALASFKKDEKRA